MKKPFTHAAWQRRVTQVATDLMTEVFIGKRERAAAPLGTRFRRRRAMSALFDFKSFLVTLLLFICTCTYVKMKAPQLMDSHRTGLRGLFWKAARVGERLSPWVAASCLVMGAHMFWTGGGQ